MLHIVLYQPEIPPNTGNIIRLCANTGTALHLIHPLGFEMTKKSLRRASLDYSELTKVLDHTNLEEMKKHLPNKKYYAVSTKGGTPLYKTRFNKGDTLLLETKQKAFLRRCCPQRTALMLLEYLWRMTLEALTFQTQSQ